MNKLEIMESFLKRFKNITVDYERGALFQDTVVFGAVVSLCKEKIKEVIESINIGTPEIIYKKEDNNYRYGFTTAVKLLEQIKQQKIKELE